MSERDSLSFAERIEAEQNQARAALDEIEECVSWLVADVRTLRYQLIHVESLREAEAINKD